MEIHYTTASAEEELQQIIRLQQKNMTSTISSQEKEKEGFVTVKHDFKILKRMNDRLPHCIAKHGDTVVGYALSMVKDFKNEIPILKPMFEMVDTNLDSKYTYMAMGQICIDKAYRKQGLFRGLYDAMRNEFQEKYDVLVTEIAATNLRSLNAHTAIGFKTLTTYTADDVTWVLVYWDWKK